MTQIRTSVDLRHPADRVWQALTDRELLPKWFASVEPRPSSISRFDLRPVDLPELAERITVELVELDAPRRIELRWPESGQRTRLVCELTPTADGCQLTVTQSDDEEPWDLADPDRRQRCYQRVLETRLPAVLDWLAFGEVDFPEPAGPERAAGPVVAAAPLTGGSTGAAAPPRRSRYRLGAGLAVAALVVGGAVVTVGLLNGRAAQSPTGTPRAWDVSPTPGPSSADATARTPGVGVATAQPSRSTRATPQRTQSAGTARTPDRTGQPRLTARYATVDRDLLDYQGEVVVTNEGDGTAAEWTLVITLPGAAEVSSSTGADYRQEDRRVTFTGARLAADESLTIRFEVKQDGLLGPKQPSDCVVQDQACAGL
ncbi:SRPBCC domain-containing protein [Plantactinospora sonchi]|uniref:SRPBCC domain-containing protein n=1 Tax=Plantactinospora sonchi TaxID=1544735 RepID=A0ABU7RU92_9ACTN